MTWACAVPRTVTHGRLDAWGLLTMGLCLVPLLFGLSQGRYQGWDDPLIRLSFASFDMVWRENGLDLFKGDQLVDGAAFDAGDLAHYATGAMDKVRWPTGILMSTRAYDRFSKDAIPIPTQRLREISHSAMMMTFSLS